MATHSSILAWRILWTVQSMGSQRVKHDWATNTFTFSQNIEEILRRFCSPMCCTLSAQGLPRNQRRKPKGKKEVYAWKTLPPSLTYYYLLSELWGIFLLYSVQRFKLWLVGNIAGGWLTSSWSCIAKELMSSSSRQTTCCDIKQYSTNAKSLNT